MMVSTFALSLTLVLAGCSTARLAQPGASASSPSPLTPTEPAKTPLTEIDLAKIGRIAPKGRVQDRQYNNSEVVNQILAYGKDAIPFLIGKLEDETVVRSHVLDYWYEVKVGDVAFVILTDLTMDSTWTKNPIPGTSWDEMLGNPKREVSADQQFYEFVGKRGRKTLRKKWETIWTKYRDRIVWDEHERCFKLDGQKS